MWYIAAMKKLLLCLVMGLAFCMPVAVHAQTVRAQQILALQIKIGQLQLLLADMVLQQDTSAGSYIAVDLTTGAIISAKNSAGHFPIASITKLMNAVVATENNDLVHAIALTSDMLTPQGYSPSLFLGAVVAGRDLLRASLIQSTNDAAEALAHAAGPEIFIVNMNQKAKDLGMDDTHFEDTHGLSLQNRSTAGDLAKLMAYIYQNHPQILATTKDTDFWLPDPTGRLLKFKNLNVFYQSPGFIGGKTGYLTEARQSIASVFNVGGKPVAIIVLYSKYRQADVASILEFVTKAR